jgi:primosomal protein N' (replication factor Y)
MHYYAIAPTKIVRSGSAYFTYASPTVLVPGLLVAIEVGKSQLVGLVLREVDQPTYDTKLITEIIEQRPLPRPLVELALWMSDYYATPLATVLQTVLPRGLQKKRRARIQTARETFRDRTTIVFTDDQVHAINALDTMPDGSALLHGVTGSGKTRIYIELAQRTLDRGQSVIILVPEIALTSQVVDEFSHHFNDIILTHSRQTEAERHLAWKDALASQTPRVIIGPRSALFMPLPSVGLIVIDEAHEPSFKQEQAPRYSALRAASILAAHHHAKVIMGTATPAIADYFIAQQNKRPVITLRNRAQTGAVKPTIKVIDMTKRTDFKHHRFLSDTLIAQITTDLEQGKQSLVFHNRRGSATTTLCNNCGWSATCPHCFTPLTLHADKHHLRCHICGLTDRVPTHCPECGGTDIIHKGIGTKLIESELRKLFPHTSIARFDGDAETGESVEERYKELYEGTINIIVGTQVIAKGLDLPHLRTVGVIQADAGLSLPDFSSSERTFQLLAQVIGRVGRSHHPTNVIIQSYQPTHPSIVDGIAQDYDHFYEHALAERRRAQFPPFVFLLKLTCIYKTETAAIKNSQQLARLLRTQLPPEVTILGPTPSFYERQRDTYRWQLTLKSAKRQHLVDALALVPATHWQTELDPTSLL